MLRFVVGAAALGLLLSAEGILFVYRKARDKWPMATLEGKACSADWSSSIRGPSNAVSFPIQNPTNFAFESKMVSKVEESRVRKQGKEQKQEVMRLHKVCKFKRSSFSEEEDATCSAMLLLACVVCDPSSI
ncbi:hypothetical protein ZIOFF_029736 [Zingiber officinale]|uniref:Uncharacterized protein n=1 Tax=Zingiber officinale TaxID=94328 RepID=A0A8J5GZ11_ZINOF|nr:hypothetical protein ZIOFF_029736 [Zingiber officinale]